MNDWNPWHEAIKAGYSFGSGALVLALGWFVGQRLTFAWNVRQKRREFQLTASQQFYAAYGEFFAVWKLWNRLDRNAASFEDRRWELHKRAAAAEAIIEGTFVKLSSEVLLPEGELNCLGRYRQAFQRLREVIRENVELSWSSSEHPEYKAFKSLSVQVAALLGSEWPEKSISCEQAAEQLMKITANTWRAKWLDDLASVESPEHHSL